MGPKSFILFEVEAGIFRSRIFATVQKETCLLSHHQAVVFTFDVKHYRLSADESCIVHGLNIS